MLPARIVIATRKSRLALWQAEHVAAILRQHWSDCQVELLPLSTRGDEILDRSLAAIGGKGLFIKELELALQSGQAHLAVHSLKDVPMELPTGFSLAAILPRASPFDAFVSSRYASLAEMPAGARVGTSSVRRQATLQNFYPHLRLQPVRGNLDTRLAKLDAGEYDALILAESGLRRLGYDARVRCGLPLYPFVPAPGQGALALEINSTAHDIAAALASLNDSVSGTAVQIERAIAGQLNGSCQTPLGVYAEPTKDGFTVHAQIVAPLAKPSHHPTQSTSVTVQLAPDQIARAQVQGNDAQWLIDQVLTQLESQNVRGLLKQWELASRESPA